MLCRPVFSPLLVLTMIGCRTYPEPLSMDDSAIVVLPTSVVIVSPQTNDMLEVDTPVMFEAVLESDVDVDVEAVVWSSSLDGVISLDEPFKGTSVLSMGHHRIQVQATVDIDTVLTNSIDVRVWPIAPDCRIVQPEFAITLTEEPIDLQAEVMGDYLDTFTVRWSSDIQGELGVGSMSRGIGESGEVRLTTNLEEGHHTLQLQVEDERGVLCTDSLTHQVVPFESMGDYDRDGDGLIGLDDCDDLNATILDGPSGATAKCSSASCAQIVEDGFSTGDGLYWILDSQQTPALRYCEMTTAGGGWTLCASVGDGETGVAFGFDNLGDPSVQSQYSRDCSSELSTIGTQILATNPALGENQIWSVIDEYLRGLDGLALVDAVRPIEDTRGLYTEDLPHGLCNFGNCVDAVNGYTIGTRIGSMQNGQYHAFGLSAHCDMACNEAIVWYNTIVTDRINLFVR